MAQPRILTFNFHEPYLCMMAQTGLSFDVGYYTEGNLVRYWREDYRPIPANLSLLEPRQWRDKAAAGYYDLIIAHNEMNAVDIANFPALGRLLVFHNRRSFIETTASVDEGDPIEGFELLLSRLAGLYEFVFISESKRDDYGFPGRVILPGIDVEAYGGYTGEEARIARVGNSMVGRNLMFDVPFQEMVCADLPNDVVGDNPSIAGSAPAPSFEALLDIYRRRRCLLQVSRQEYEDGYNLVTLEAMACGMPVVSLDNRTSPVRDGENGLSSYDAMGVRERLMRLLDDRELALELGARGRETVARRFPMSAFVEKWRAAIFEAVEGKQYAAGVSRILADSAPPLLLHFTPESESWGRMLELAASQKFHLLTVGTERHADACVAARATRGAPPRLIVGDTETAPRLLPALPQGYVGRCYLYVGPTTGPIPVDLDGFKGVRIACLTGSSTNEENNTERLHGFDLLFCVDRPFAAQLRDAGFNHVFTVEPGPFPDMPDDAAISVWRDILWAMLTQASEVSGGRAMAISAHSPKARHYYEQPRREIMPFVPLTTRRLLDVGCGTGTFALELKKSRKLETACGIELMPEAAQQAASVLDRVAQGDIESMALPFEDRYFDCITCADVLEHLSDPSAALAKLAQCLAPNGVIVGSIPNAGYHEVLTMLSQGAWTYMEAGILDETHLRFFTRDEIFRLFEDAGLCVIKITPLSMYNRDKIALEPDGSIQLGKLRIEHPTEDDFERILTYQYLVIGCKPDADLLAPARAALEAGDLDAAYAAAGQAEAAPEEKRQLVMGRAAARAGMLERAEKHYVQSLAANRTPEAAGEYGILLVGTGRADKAMPLLEYCIDRLPDHERAAGALGLVLMEKRRFAEAFARLDAVLAAGFKQVALVRPFIQCAHQINRLEDCLERVRAHVEFHTNNVELMGDYAELLLALSRPAEARECLDMARLMQPDNPRIRALLEKIHHEGV